MKTVDDVINHLGRARLADALEVGDTAIANAKKRGCFPSNWFAVVSALCGNSGVECSSELFNFKSPKAGASAK